MNRREFVGGVAAVPLLMPGTAVGQEGRAQSPATLFDDFTRAERFGGVVALASGGRLTHSATYGLADVEAGVPHSLATRFKVGSASKWLTSVAVLRLVEHGVLALDAPVTRYLPEFRADTGARVTLRRMLSNTSGVTDLLNAAMPADPSIRTSMAGSAEMLRRFGGGDIAFEPGSKFDYNIINWVIVHALLERVTGKPFATVLDELVFRPLKMRSAAMVDTVRPSVAGLAAAYSGPARKMGPVPPFAGASGNICLDAVDCVRAAHGVFAGGLLSRQSRNALTTIEFAPENYALGGRVRTIAGRRWAWETGKVQGYRTVIAHDLERDRTIVILNNTDMEQVSLAAVTERMIAATR